MKRRVCVFTGSRADYGLLKPLMNEIQRSPELDLRILVSGAHLSNDFGMTYKEIEEDGFIIDEKIDIQLISDTPQGICNSMGHGMTGYSEALHRLEPDLVVILGDRYEAFTMAAAATVCRVPIAHIHGGETTQGAIDEAFRHSITKMSHIHFTSTEDYGRRVIQLGENPERVIVTGALGIESILNLNFLSKEELAEELDFDLGDHFLLVTYHPVTLENNSSKNQFQNLLAAIEQFPDCQIIFTKTNTDPDGKIINSLTDKFVEKSNGRAKAFTSLGQLKYLSAMKYASAVVGNSSSGIIEAPSLKVPTLNIGDRQKGRTRANSIIDCCTDKNDIIVNLQKVLSGDFNKLALQVENPYEGTAPAKNITNILHTIDLSNTLKKEFYDINVIITGNR
ncbi:MAG: UDP-N-acetylglucosamine 2-epimerase [Desulfobacterales bacterium SG8_35_2]|nr:MAG: UDP-N-acetylglucosamine 2-epimerase [Desulfobacterales bacterium SG8_35_2]